MKMFINTKLMYVLKYIFLALLLVISACKSQRVIDSSQRNQPGWVYGVQPGYIVGVGTGNTVNAARNNAVTDIRTKITESVYNEIKSRTYRKTKETQHNNTYDIVSTFVNEITTVSDRGVAVRGISISNARDYYYERVRDRKSGQEVVMYAVKYPFTRMEMESYMNEWRSRQQQLIDQKNEIAGRVGKYESLKDVFADIFRLRQLREELMPDHAASVDVLISRNYHFLNGIQLIVVNEEDDYLHFTLKYQGRSIKLDWRPTVTSNVVDIESVTAGTRYWKVKFSEKSSKAIRDYSPEIHFRLQYRDWEFEHRHTFKPDIKLKVVPPFFFNVVSYSFWRTSVRAFDIIIETKVSGLGGVTLERIILNPVKHSGTQWYSLSRITIELNNGLNLKTGYDSKRIRVNHSINRNDFSTESGEHIIVNATVLYRENLTGKRNRAEFKNIELKTDW